MKFRNKKREKEEEKFNYKPSKMIIVSAIFISSVLAFSDTNSLLFAISQTLLFLTFVSDIEIQKQRRGEN